VKFELNRSKFSFNLSLKTCSLIKTCSANLGNFSVSGGEFISERLFGYRASLKNLTCGT